MAERRSDWFRSGDANLYRYVGNKVTGNVDPDGKIIVPVIAGAVFGAGFDVASQMLIQGRDWDEINWTRVAVSAVIGGRNPGWFGGKRKGFAACESRETVRGPYRRSISESQPLYIAKSSHQADDECEGCYHNGETGRNETSRIECCENCSGIGKKNNSHGNLLQMSSQSRSSNHCQGTNRIVIACRKTIELNC